MAVQFSRRSTALNVEFCQARESTQSAGSSAGEIFFVDQVVELRDLSEIRGFRQLRTLSGELIRELFAWKIVSVVFEEDPLFSVN